MDVIFNPPSRIKQKNSFTVSELRELVLAAQAEDQQAIDTLCKAFEPLIIKEATRPLIRNTLGEDAINTAWVIFLSIIKKYKGTKFSHLPGLLSWHVRYGLQRAAFRHIEKHDYDSLDIDGEDGALLQVADKEDHIERFTTNKFLQEALPRLTQNQRLVIEALYFEGKSEVYCSNKFNMTKQSCHVHKKRALKKLRNFIFE